MTFADIDDCNVSTSSASKAAAAKFGKSTWTAEEDALLIRLVADQGAAANWSAIAVHMPGKKSKQCRERYHNHLASGVRKGDWSKEEEARLFELQAEYGNAWAKIAACMPGRTDNSVKNRFNSLSRSLQNKAMKASLTEELKLARLQAKREKRAQRLGLVQNQQQQDEEGATDDESETPSRCHISAPAPRQAMSVPSLALHLLTASQNNNSNTTTINNSNSNAAAWSSRSAGFDTFRAIRDLFSDSEDSSDSEASECALELDLDMDMDDMDLDMDFEADLCGMFSARSSLGESEADKNALLEEYDQFFLPAAAGPASKCAKWWEEKDLAFDMPSILRKLDITPRATPRGLTPRQTPRSPFLLNLKKQRRRHD